MICYVHSFYHGTRSFHNVTLMVIICFMNTSGEVWLYSPPLLQSVLSILANIARNPARLSSKETTSSTPTLESGLGKSKLLWKSNKALEEPSGKFRFSHSMAQKKVGHVEFLWCGRAALKATLVWSVLKNNIRRKHASLNASAGAQNT